MSLHRRHGGCEPSRLTPHWDKQAEHAERLKLGLKELGPGFCAELCWWCDGITSRNFEHCRVCGKGRFYGTALGLLIHNEPAPESGVNQVLVAAERALQAAGNETGGRNG